MSLGGRGKNSIVFAAVKRAHAAGVLVVAAGNSNSDACNYSPAGAPEAVTVGSTTNSDLKSGFSSHGKCVDIHAPGSSIKAAWATSDSATRTISGTSMATPHVAGAAAQLLTERPTYSTDRTTEVLKCMATKNAIKGLPSNTVNSLLYAGSAMDDKALTACGSAPPPPPASTTFDFDTAVPAGWDSVRRPNTYRFIRKSGRTSSSGTGPSAGYGNKGYYYYAETSSPRKQGDRFVIGYDGVHCMGGYVASVQFKYHMYGATMGTLRLMADSRMLWSASGNKGNKWLDSGVVPVTSPASNGGFTFEYVRGSSYTGDATIDHVTIVCKTAPPVDRPMIERLMNEVQAKFTELKKAFDLYRPTGADEVADEEVARRLSEEEALAELPEGEDVEEEQGEEDLA